MSVNEDPSTWRLQTSGGVKYKLVHGFPNGTFEDEDASIQEKYIIRSTDLLKFVSESFPSTFSTPLGDIQVFPNRPMPGLGSLSTKNISFESLDSGRPVDPFGSDPTASEKTYSQFLYVTITYGTGKNKGDPNDPKTFLEISGNATGELLQISPDGSGTFDSASGDPIENPVLPVTKTIPTIEWNVRWSQIPKEFFPTLLKVMRPKVGTVNQGAMPLLENAPAETVMFVGFSWQDQYTWKSDALENPLSDQPPVLVDMKFTEKNIEFTGDGGVKLTAGWNHAWRPNKGGWSELFINGNPPFERENLNAMFPPTLTIPPPPEP